VVCGDCAARYKTPMWFVLGGVLYLVLVFTLGVMTLRKGHWVMFIVGLFFPIFWIIGAMIRPAARSG
jgi:hypothetical protein